MFIGDTHGDYSRWCDFIPLFKEVEKIVFVGDYLDSWNITNVDMLDNLNTIINLKKDNPDKVILLLGNHELSYLYPDQKCSGYRGEYALAFKEVLQTNIDLFQNAWQYGNTIATHAGITHDWFVNRFRGSLDKDIAEQLNNPENPKQLEALYQVGSVRGGMRYDVGGPFWCDRTELKKPLQDYLQVVGHTPVDSHRNYKFKTGEVYFIDCLEHFRKPLILEI